MSERGQFNLRLDRQTTGQLKSLAKQMGISMSDVVRLLIKDEFHFQTEYGSWRISKRK